MTAPSAPARRALVGPLRRVGAPILVVLAALCALLSVFAIWANRQAVEDAGWRATSEQITSDPDVQQALARYLVDELYANVDLAALVEKTLPKNLDALAIPATGALRGLIERGAGDALRHPRVQGLLEQALVDAHATAVRILREQGATIETGDGTVILNLQQVLIGVAEQVGIDGKLLASLPPDTGRIELLRSDQLRSAQTGLRLLERLAVVMPLLTVALLAAALWVADRRRRETLRLAGLAFLVAALAVPVLRTWTGNLVIDAIDPSPTYLTAARDAWDISTAMLVEAGQALGLYAILILVGTTLLGPTRLAHATRAKLRRICAPQIAYPLAALIVVGLVWWSPTAGLRRPAIAVTLIALLLIGLEVSRRQIIREALAAGAWPPRGGELSVADVGEAVTARLKTLTHRRPDRLAELERAHRLHADGVLSDEEFAAEKRRILGGD